MGEFSEKSTKLSEKFKSETWIDKKWRPMMGWSYFVTCTFDFIIFPILWSMAQVIFFSDVFTQWEPITLQGGGLYHVAMGAIVGVTSWQRSNERISCTTQENAINYYPSSNKFENYEYKNQEPYHPPNSRFE